MGAAGVLFSLFKPQACLRGLARSEGMERVLLSIFGVTPSPPEVPTVCSREPAHLLYPHLQ